jgi:hypothetical protein
LIDVQDGQIVLRPAPVAVLASAEK